MQANELLARIESNSAPVIIDPRSPMEFKQGHIPGAVNAPIWKLLLGMAHLPKDRSLEMVLACMHGQRAKIAKALLAFYGYRNTKLLDGFVLGWKEAGLPMEK
jgi:hydroxyacylglutathione hydrolase